MSMISADRFSSIQPWNYSQLTFPSPFPPDDDDDGGDGDGGQPLLRVSVLDSPSPSPSPSVAAMLVPPGRDSDWTFSTLAGHLQLLLSLPGLSRLILVGAHPGASPSVLAPLLASLAPRGHPPEIPFLDYEDDLLGARVLEVCEGPVVGEMLVEDVVLGLPDGRRESRRRLRFKRMPNSVQTQIRIAPDQGLDHGALVHPYLPPMLAGLTLVGGHLDQRLREGVGPKALCLGVGGGALLRFLNSRMGFQVFGVEEDETVLQLARKYFGLESSDSVHLCAADGIKTIQKLADRDSTTSSNTELSGTDCGENGWSWNSMDCKFDVIMVDMDSSDAKLGTCAPPMEFIKKSVLMAAKTILCELGALIINVIPPTKSFYEMLINEFAEVFAELYEIDVGNEENFVLIALVSDATASGTRATAFTDKLRESISECYIESIRKISNSVN